MVSTEEGKRDEQSVSMMGEPGETMSQKRHRLQRNETVCQKISYAWKHSTVGPVFFFFLAAYMFQTSLVKTYIEHRLQVHYNISHCQNASAHESAEPIGPVCPSTSVEETRHKRSVNSGSKVIEHEVIKQISEHEPHTSKCHELLEEYEKELSYWNIILLVIYAAPSLVLAPLLGSWNDGLHRVRPMYICVLGLMISSIGVGINIILKSSVNIVVACTLPSGLTGGAILFSLTMYSYEASKNENFEIFESYLTLQAIYVAAKTFVQILIYLGNKYVYAKPILIWAPLVFSLVACFGLLHRRIKDKRPTKFYLCHFTFIHTPKQFFHLIKSRLWAFHFMLFICAFVFYYAYVGETSEIMTILIHDESWEIASFSIFGAAQGAIESVGLLLTLYFWKTFIHKKIIDKEMLPHFSVFMLGILGFVSDMITKIVIAVTPPNTYVQYWEPLIGVIAELAIVVIRYFLVLLVSKEDAGKVLSLVSMAQILSTIPGAISAKAFFAATCHTWSNFVYLFLALLQLIPICLFLIIIKFSKLPEIDLYPEEEEEKKQEEETKENGNAIIIQNDQNHLSLTQNDKSQISLKTFFR